MHLRTAPILACFLILVLPSCKNNQPSTSTEPEIIRIDGNPFLVLFRLTGK